MPSTRLNMAGLLIVGGQGISGDLECGQIPAPVCVCAISPSLFVAGDGFSAAEERQIGLDSAKTLCYNANDNLITYCVAGAAMNRIC